MWRAQTLKKLDALDSRSSKYILLLLSSPLSSTVLSIEKFLDSVVHKLPDEYESVPDWYPRIAKRIRRWQQIFKRVSIEYLQNESTISELGELFVDGRQNLDQVLDTITDRMDTDADHR